MFKLHAALALDRWAHVAAASFTAWLTVGIVAADELQIRVASGREYRGELDPLTSRQQLVLKSGNQGLEFRRAIAWGAIEQIRVQGSAVEVESLRARAADNVTRRSKTTLDLKTLHVKTGSPETVFVRPAELAVAWVGFDAGLANWDGDVEMDGLVVELVPLDFEGRLAAVSGTVEVELFIPQRRAFDLAPMSGGDTLELVERWTRVISAADFGPSGVRLRLPFGAIHPELRPEWVASHYGLVHVRLAAPGQGVFEASRDGVRVVPWAPNRDRLEIQTGQRFLWTERLGRAE